MASLTSRFEICVFLYWGYVENRVFREPVKLTPELNTKICQASATITEETLQRVYKNLEIRLSILIGQGGEYFEHLVK